MNNSNSNDNSDSVELLYLPEYTAVLSLIFCSLIVGIGVLGNALVILVISTSKVLRSSTNIFLLNLSIADLLVLVTCTPTVIVELVIRKDAWILGKTLCYLVPFVELAMAHTSVLIILAITGERYYAICLPLHAGSICRKSKAWILCGISWTFAFGCTAPVLATIEYSNEGDSPYCLTNVDTIWAKVYFYAMLILFFCIPLILLMFIYKRISDNLVSSSNQINFRESKAVVKSRKQVVVMIATVVFVFFACLFPFKVLTLWIVVSPHEIFDIISIETYYNLLYFCRIMFYINSAINPILYNIMSTKFREGFKRAFQCCIFKTSFIFMNDNPSGNFTKSQNTFTSSISSDNRGNGSKKSIVYIEERKIIVIPADGYDEEESTRKKKRKQNLRETHL
ncbi:growth hormone secretagogue receptor type 1 [Lepeophtheirus salmonis]|uniref:growth hormone secretagogue receptor type 1 n=1 Tax=Lepeophtheirus salmonis TaxID=72036 RepID=UPI001AE952D1|nr:growth hormone secretagogue receptor type 1-like [Lepeophtheirus salmonis]XP_040576617.1 growth hormone secretagogue receptor type 1-like [Lepeophtheirus salmonis]